jgi:alanine-synthesizing transaminase
MLWVAVPCTAQLHGLCECGPVLFQWSLQLCNEDWRKKNGRVQKTDAATPVCIQYYRHAEGRGPQARRRHHRLRHGQPRRRDSEAHRRQADRSRAEDRNPSLLALARAAPLRKAICDWYQRRYAVELDPETEAIVTIGSKEGIAHLCLAMLDHEDTVAVPNPSYPIHIFGPVIAGSKIQTIALEDTDETALIETLERELPLMNPRPKMLILNFPANPTTQCVELSFFERLVPLCKDLGIYIIHDLAYADLVFDGYRAPSILEVPGAKEIAVEFFTLSKSYNMPGWRVGFMVGCPKLVAALGRIKSYFDYGTFTPIQVASIAALDGPQQCVAGHCCELQIAPRRACRRHEQAGLAGGVPKATMFVWAKIPEQFRAMGSLDFSKKLLIDAKTAVSPGIGFGEHGDNFVRFALIENEERTRQALRGMKQMFKTG